MFSLPSDQGLPMAKHVWVEKGVLKDLDVYAGSGRQKMDKAPARR